MKYISNKERKYRNKIIAENHLKKDAQKYLDNYVASKNHSYKELYLGYVLVNSMLVQYSFDKLGNAMKTLGTSAKQMSDAFRILSVDLAIEPHNH